MIKAIFLDFSGTMVHEDDPYIMQLMRYFLTSSDLNTPEKVLTTVWGMLKKLEWDCFQDTFIKKDAMVDRILADCVREYHLTADLSAMHTAWRNSWLRTPLFDDVRPFVEHCPLPVYVVTNNDLSYTEQNLAEKGLSVAGIVSSEMALACKPHPEILLEALRIAGVKPEKAVLIGDSEKSDIPCAGAAGITPVLLDREGRIDGSRPYRVIHSLTDFNL